TNLSFHFFDPVREEARQHWQRSAHQERRRNENDEACYESNETGAAGNGSDPRSDCPIERIEPTKHQRDQRCGKANADLEQTIQSKRVCGTVGSLSQLPASQSQSSHESAEYN